MEITRDFLPFDVNKVSSDQHNMWHYLLKMILILLFHKSRILQVGRETIKRVIYLEIYYFHACNLTLTSLLIYCNLKLFLRFKFFYILNFFASHSEIVL